ncbi:DUF4340 domain-containing protein [Pyxidicoccus xibeiensis]|uniref:DUF4340 domain-containing protein n=1 Tax=Pyxidicoccus xibeiensis TaxID=2906759 RepID=UPI0020A7E644|nr:DUF4340 domain-containing protein [Pyxidicoccus xibeiensis]MCP3143686.1 DUF4340 domain-containing protein [Pyxidicoccus xibeiensis]
MTQARKNLVTLLALTAAAAGLGLYAWYGVREPEQQQAAQQQASEQLFAAHEAGARGEDGGAPPAPVFTKLTVKATSGTTELVREQGGGWKVTAPVAARAEQAAVEAIASTLGSSRFSSVVDEAPTDADLEKYGLKTPVFTVTAQAYVPDAKGGGADDPARQRTVTLHGGIENTFDGSVYVRREGDPKVYAAPGAVRWSLDKDTFALRAKEFLGPLVEASFQGIEVKAKTNAYQLARDPGGTGWRLVKPVAERADEVRVADLLTALKDQHALSFPVDSPETRKKLGLEAPAVDARFIPATGEPVRVRLSRVTEDGAIKVYALREQGAQALLGEVPETALAVLDVGVPELKDKRVLAFRREDVRRVVFHPGGGAEPITVARVSGTDGGAGAWEVESPKPGKAQHFKVASLLGSLDTYKAVAFGEPKPKSWAKYGISDASRGAALLGADGKELARLWLGHEVKDKPGTVYARGSSADVLEVSATWVELPAKVEDVLEAPPSPAVTDGGTDATAAPTP